LYPNKILIAKLQLQLADKANHIFISEGNKYVVVALMVFVELFVLKGSLVVFTAVKIGKKSQTKQAPIKP
jgi:hypothetical protein